jgi:sulfoxide reductase catalytic subunit YedY
MKSPGDIKSSEITPQATFLSRRRFMQGAVLAGTSLATAGIYRAFRSAPDMGSPTVAINTIAESSPEWKPMPGDTEPSMLKDITGYNNYYEFSTDKSRVARAARHFVTSPWAVEVGGMVQKPRTLGLEDLMKLEQYERVYRFRCVEGWSMVIPWVGFPLRRLLAMVEPLGKATHVAFETYYNKTQMPDADDAGIDLPYVEGLRLDEALHPLTLLATGLYGKTLPNQNGAPLRLVVPWKYGFKSIKSVVKITLTDREPPTTWNKANAEEYGFYSNVNPAVNHPRWSQASERRIGEFGSRKTLLFNGYADQVGSLYTNLDLRKNF